MCEYGWDIKQVLSHTFYQLKHLSNAIEQRRYTNRSLNLHLIRVAQNGKQKDVSKFLRDINPQSSIQQPKKRTAREVPQGFAKK